MSPKSDHEIISARLVFDFETDKHRKQLFLNDFHTASMSMTSISNAYEEALFMLTEDWMGIGMSGNDSIIIRQVRVSQRLWIQDWR